MLIEFDNIMTNESKQSPQAETLKNRKLSKTKILYKIFKFSRSFSFFTDFFSRQQS